MKIDKIKPIPKYILKLVKKEDAKRRQDTNETRYYSYLTKNDGELVSVSVAVKYRYSKFYCKQVVVHGLHSDTCFAKDIDLFYIGGYRTGWYAEGLTKYKKNYEDGIWYEYDDKYFNLFAPVVNKDFLTKYPEYKYSQVENYHATDILNYLKLYNKYPQMELLMKFGLERFVTHKTILNKTSKDKRFARWLINHREEISSYKYDLYANALIRAYSKNISVEEAQRFLHFKNSIIRESRLKPIGKLFKGDKAVEQLISYLDSKSINVYTYTDYIDACNYLHIDLSQAKNLIPHDFKRWHDERIEQQRILQEEEHRKWLLEIAKRERRRKAEERQRQKDLDNLESNFMKVVKRFIKLQNCEQSDYIMIIAKTPAELIIEGQQLNHCVGGEKYRLRMSKAESLIFFVREAAEPDKPFVTVEYSPKKQQVLQCYGYDDIPPADNVKQFVNKIWLPYANQITNKLLRKKAA